MKACAPGEDGGYFVNAFGLSCQEVTASNLVRVGFEGNIIDPGSTQFGVNRPGLLLHSALHKAKGDIKCIIYIHSNAAVAVSIVSLSWNNLILIVNLDICSKLWLATNLF